jgi:hypothetical protein
MPFTTRPAPLKAKKRTPLRASGGGVRVRD